MVSCDLISRGLGEGISKDLLLASWPSRLFGDTDLLSFEESKYFVVNKEGNDVADVLNAVDITADDIIVTDVSGDVAKTDVSGGNVTVTDVADADDNIVADVIVADAIGCNVTSTDVTEDESRVVTDSTGGDVIDSDLEYGNEDMIQDDEKVEGGREGNPGVCALFKSLLLSYTSTEEDSL